MAATGWVLRLVLGVALSALGAFVALRPLFTHFAVLTGARWLDVTFALVFLVRGLREHQVGAPSSRWDESLNYPRLMPRLMAFFKRKEKAPAEVERLDWRLLERGAVALYHKGSVLSQDLAWLRQQRYVVHELDAAQWRNPRIFTTPCSGTLGFPAYYGKNLASWIDCVAELAGAGRRRNGVRVSPLRRVRESAAAARADDSRQPRNDVAPVSAHRPAADRARSIRRSRAFGSSASARCR